jgi:receptor protein-tyrosine kinase
VSSTSGASASDLYQGNRLSQDRVLSYTELLMGETLAQRTIDKLGLQMSAPALKERVTATAKLDTVLIKVNVLDESPVRARDIANGLSDELVLMVRELETPQPGARPDARVVVEQRASIPAAPLIPNKKRNVAVGMVLGLFLGLGLAFARTALDNTIKNKEALDEITDVGLVGVIPFDKEVRNQPSILFDARGHSAIAESFRRLRTNLQFLAVDNPPRVILVTSSVSSEGKSTTSLNIALALAEADNKVVLVDGDLRRPALNKYLNALGSVGFSSVLSGGATLSEVLQETGFANLTFLAAGTTPPNPSELLGSLAAQKVLSELREQFDYVIVDSAPLLAVTDSAILATKTDGALLVCRLGQTKREQLGHAVGSLEDVGATLLGAIFTMAPTRGASGYGYSYGYSYQYYGQEQPKGKRLGRQSASGPTALEGHAVVDRAEDYRTPSGPPATEGR